MKDRIIYIDLDDTIIKNNAVSIALSEAYKKISLITNVNLDFVKHEAMRTHLEFVKNNDIRAFDWDFLVNLVSNRLGHGSLNINVEDLIKMYSDRIIILDNALDMLKKLKEKYVLVLGTNGLYKYQRWAIDRCGLSDYFDEIITPDKAGCIKTCRKFYSYPDEDYKKLVIGDHLIFDVYYPKKFGLETILVDRGYKQSIKTYAESLGVNLLLVKPDFIIKHLNEVFQII
ncbi:MAG: HAD family hydrolase [Thermoprotei archaeon]|jgi:putative hydrolase of the HAD superfamily